ncbi:tetratricopeptide repeat protein [Roseimaritima sediminicola]|uniref:tetratricopeptide repeat protein n=1 Tax=Roseimaritima sediminicola TaxID=2662066 RepID=UPI001298310F|nr:tetratricopeptide repeat protein [Roseimaritima sediminicola]
MLIDSPRRHWRLPLLAIVLVILMGVAVRRFSQPQTQDPGAPAAAPPAAFPASPPQPASDPTVSQPSLARASDPSLVPVRIAASQIFAAESDDQRGQAAVRCQHAATDLLDRDDATGTTAAMYYVAVAPLTGTQGRLAVPGADAVRQVATEDLLLIARLLFNTRRFQPADQLVTLILSRDDELRVEGLKLAITIRYDIGRDRDVLAHADELIELEPENPQYHRVQMMVHRNHGRWDNFIPAAERALELTDQTDYVLLVELADGYTHVGRLEDAAKIVRRLKEERPDLLAQAPTMHARLLLQQGETQQAQAIIDRLLEQAPDDDEALLMKGKMLVSEGEFEAAVEIFQRLLEIAPSQEQAYYQLGQAYARLDEPERASEYLEKHRQLLDAKVRLYSLEQRAAAEPYNREVREELVASYQEIGLEELAEFWKRSLDLLPRIP